MKADVVQQSTARSVGAGRLDEAVWGIEPNIRGDAPGAGSPAGERAPRHRRTKTRGRSSRRWPQAVAPEGHRPRPAGLDPRAALVGGGVVFGPHPRDYTQAMPKQMRRPGRAIGAVGQVRDERMTVIDGLDGDRAEDQGDEGRHRAAA